MSKTFITSQIIPTIFARIIAGILALICLGIAFTGVYLLLLPVLIYVVLMYSFNAVDINSDEKTYREYLSLIGYKIGETKALPAIEYVLVKDTVLVSNDRYSDETGDDFYEISLVCHGPMKIHLFKTYSDTKAVSLASDTAKKLNCKIEDHTKEKLFNK